MDKIDNPTSDDATFRAKFHTARRGGQRVLETSGLKIGYDHVPISYTHLDVYKRQSYA